VVGDIHFAGVKKAATAEVYMPHTENLFPMLALVMRITGDPGRIAPLLRSAVLGVDREQALERIATMDDVIGEEFSVPRFHMVLVAGFAALALLLAGVGIYGVVACSVAERRREIGIRMALGASPAGVVWSVLREAGTLSLAGVAVGVVAALAATRVLASFLFGVKPTDPLTLAAGAGLLGLVALAAGFVPARRAVRVDPVEALRQE
jgi:ABC-type antimicrobial peptide transport system permease subunit